MPKVRLKKKGRENRLATAKDTIPDVICVDCKSRMVDVVKKNIVRLEEEKINNKNPVLTPHEFKSAMTKSVGTLMKRNTTVEQIKQTLLQRYPEHSKQITTVAIKSVIHGMMNSKEPQQQQQQPTATNVKIEYEYSLFIDDALIVINTSNGESIHAHLMCALGSQKGLEKLSVRLDKRLCGQEFVTSVLEGLDTPTSYQIVMRSSVENVQKVEQMFTGYKSMHTLVFFPHNVPVYNPVRKYFTQLANLLPEKPDIKYSLEQVEALIIKASKKILKKDCKRWIHRYLSHC